MSITIQEFIQREIIICVSPLIYALTQEKLPCATQDELRLAEGELASIGQSKQQCLDEELAIELWTGPIDYGEALYAINQDGSYLGQKNGLWGLYDNDEPDNPIVPYEYKTQSELIDYYFEDMDWDLEQYRSKILEHWIVSPYLARKLKEEGETVVDLYHLDVWARPYSGQMLQADEPIISIYKKLTA